MGWFPFLLPFAFGGPLGWYAGYVFYMHAAHKSE